jgi:pimeloyl-ACP methyl ester carboxylesterase
MRGQFRGETATRGLNAWTGAIVLALLMLAALGLLATTLADDARAARTGPQGNAFYEPPPNLPKGHGRLIWKRRAGSYVQLENAAYTKKVLYTSKSPQRQRIAVSGSISVPEGRPPRGGWPVITYAHGTTGVADRCAPSRLGAKSPVIAYVDYVNPDLEQWLELGYAVVRTDYPGLGTPGPRPYLIGKSEGRSVLDIVRAARELEPDLARRFAIAGHSQGGQSALFAAGLYGGGWTPELKLRGTVSYAPASHLLQQANALSAFTSPSPLSALATLILYGAATANPAVTPENTLRPQPLAMYPTLEQKCLPQLGKANRFGGIAPSKLLRPGQPDAAFSQVLAKMNPAVTTEEPILLAQGTADTTVLPALTDFLDGELRDLGDDVDYRKYPGITHSEIVAAAESDVVAFLQQRLPPG